MLLPELPMRARFGKYILHPDLEDGRGMMFAEHGSDRITESSQGSVFFGHDDPSSLARRGDEALGVQRLDGMDIEEIDALS